MRVLAGADLLAPGLTLAIGAAGGLVALALGLPLPLMLGALIATGAVALAGRRPFGRALVLPMPMRAGFLVVIGVSIGGAFTPEVAAGARAWWPSLLALGLYLPLAHGTGLLLYRWGGLPAREGFFGAVPGGMVEAVQLGEEAGADPALVTVLQFLRLILTILAVPLLFTALTGGAVGSAAGVAPPGSAEPLPPREAALLLVLGLAGLAGGRVLRLPAAPMTGPLILSALAHGTGLVQGGPPGWLVGVTQVVIGCSLGVRFAGADRRLMRRAAPLAVLNAALALGLAASFAAALAGAAGQPPAAVFLAFAPGGIAEMSLIALSLNFGTAYVTTHHLLRIVLSLLVARAGARLGRG